ncbi:MAG: SDR family oxidoreductase [Aphanocapsa lilacina HA4352-LM1]|nr:SDR family oxidoreductase [Aphanocapsa lilacina HA4352-LM1]
MPTTAVITGANGGIGRALCSVFKAAGYRVVALDVREGECECDHFVPVDLQKLCLQEGYRDSSLDRLRAELPPEGLYALINNAAVQRLGATGQITPADWRETLDVNLTAPFLLIQGLLGELERAGGSVVNIASVHAKATKPGFVSYATSKAALVGLTHSLAVDLGSRVRVNAICPAAVATPMLKAGFEGRAQQWQDLARMHPLGRIAEPEEVARAALFLVSPQAAFVSGTALDLDGGISHRLHDPA